MYSPLTITEANFHSNKLNWRDISLQEKQSRDQLIYILFQLIIDNDKHHT